MIGGTLVAGGGISSVLQACGGEAEQAGDATAVTRAQVENASGQIRVLNYPIYQQPELNAGPVQAEYTETGAASSLISKVRLTREGLDMTVSGANIMPQLYPLDRLAAIETSVLSNYDSISSTVSDAPIFSNDGSVYAVPFAVSVGFAAWDSSTVPEPTSSDDLLGPDYAGTIGILNESDSLIGIAQALGFDINNFTVDDLDQCVDFLDNLKPNIKTLFAYGEDLQLLSRGDIAVSLWTYGSVLTDTQANNPQVRANFLGSTSYVDSWSILNGADYPASLAWIDNTLSKPSQLAIVKTTGGYPVLPSAYDPSLYPPELRDLTLDEALEQSPPNPGVPSEGDGLVTRDLLDETWTDFRASFI
jgi:putative spermidine/putrescine transport system substrate-binding protein